MFKRSLEDDFSGYDYCNTFAEGIKKELVNLFLERYVRKKLPITGRK